MANVASATNFFPTAQEGFTTTTSGTVSSGAATVGLNSVAGYANGAVVTLVIDPTDLTKKQAFTGIIDTSGVQVTGVVWTEGTNTAHSAGATVVDYETATAWALYNKGLLVGHNQSGTHKAFTESNIVPTAAIQNDAVNYLKVAAGMPVQVVSTTFNAVATGTTTIPLDDTIPQITEGNEFMTQAITPKSATNILLIRAVLFLASSTADNNISVALFQDATANALAVQTVRGATVTNVPNVLVLEYSMVAGTVSSTTFRIRAGGSAAATFTFNGANGARLFGTAAKASIVVTEYKA